VRPRRFVELATSAEPALLLGLAALLMLLLSKSYVVQSDEGHTLSAAWQLWNGLRMYDDFQEFAAPGSGYAVYLSWALTGGPSFLAARVLSLLLSFSSIGAVYLLMAKRGVRGPGLAIAVVAWVVASSQYVPLNHNAFSSYAAIWLLLLFLRAQERDRAGSGRLVDHAWVGVAAGCVTLFLQTKGLMTLAAVAAMTLFAARGRRGVRATAALATGAIAVLAPLLLVWRPSVLLREWFIVPLEGEYLGHTSASSPLAIGCLLVTGAMAAIAIRLRDRSLIAVAVMQAALVASILYNVEANHVAIISFPLLVFVPLALRRSAARRPSSDAGPDTAAAPGKLSALATTAIAVATFATIFATPAGRPLFRASTLNVDFIERAPRNPFPQPRVAAAAAIYAGPFLPGFYFLLNKRNPFFVSETVVCNDQACQLRLLAQIRRVKPEIAFLAYDMTRHLGYDENNPVDLYFRDNYVRCPQTDYEGLLVRAVEARWCP
jgi:hypothetical protein